MNPATRSSWSGTLSAGAWPQPAISTTRARPRSAGPRRQHLGRRLAQHQVGVGAAQAQHRHVDAVVVLPQLVVARMVDELAHHRRVVVRRHAAVGQAPRRRLGQPPPLRIAQPAVGLVDLAEERFQLAPSWRRPAGCRHRPGCARARGCASRGALSLSTRLRMRPFMRGCARPPAHTVPMAPPIEVPTQCALRDAQLRRTGRPRCARRRPACTRCPGPGSTG